MKATRGRRRLAPTAEPAIGDRYEVEGHVWTLVAKMATVGAKTVTAFKLRADNGAIAIVHPLKKEATR